LHNVQQPPINALNALHGVYHVVDGQCARVRGLPAASGVEHGTVEFDTPVGFVHTRDAGKEVSEIAICLVEQLRHVAAPLRSLHSRVRRRCVARLASGAISGLSAMPVPSTDTASPVHAAPTLIIRKALAPARDESQAPAVPPLFRPAQSADRRLYRRHTDRRAGVTGGRPGAVYWARPACRSVRGSGGSCGGGSRPGSHQPGLAVPYKRRLLVSVTACGCRPIIP